MLQVLLIMLRDLFILRKTPWLTTIRVCMASGDVTFYERRHIRDDDQSERCWSQAGEIWVVTKGGYENAVAVAREAVKRASGNVLAQQKPSRLPDWDEWSVDWSRDLPERVAR